MAAASGRSRAEILGMRMPRRPLATQFTGSSDDRDAKRPTAAFRRRYDGVVRIASPLRRRLAMTASGLVAAVLLASSCSLDAAVETDRSGRVVGIHALEVRSRAFDLALALALDGRDLVLQLRWRPGPADAGIAL